MLVFKSSSLFRLELIPSFFYPDFVALYQPSVVEAMSKLNPFRSASNRVIILGCWLVMVEGMVRVEVLGLRRNHLLFFLRPFYPNSSRSDMFNHTLNKLLGWSDGHVFLSRIKPCCVKSDVYISWFKPSFRFYLIPIELESLSIDADSKRFSCKK